MALPPPTETLGSGTDQPVTIRFAGPADATAVDRLAALDSARTPQGELLLAEVAGKLRAALPLAGGAPVADPFFPSASLVALLRARAGQLQERAGARRPVRAAAPACCT